MSIVSARALSKAYGARSLFEGISLTVEPGDRVGLLGMNGAGKSTLLRVMAGLEPADAGVVDRQRDTSILYLSQEPELPADKTPRAIVAAGLKEWHAATERYEAISRQIEREGTGAALLTEQAHLAEAIERLGGWERGHVVGDMLAKLGVREPDREVATMSGGERRRVALAALLVAQPALAILDEPTNHLDADTIEWLEEYLASQFPGAVLLVTHDRYVLDAIATRIVELENGALTEYEGNYGDYLEQRETRMAHADRAESNRLNLVRRERAWLMRGARARSTKQKARIQRAEAVIAIEGPREQQRVQLDAVAAGMGKTILELRDVSLDLGGRTLVKPMTLHMVSGDRIGIIGPNGAGKTSLLKLVSGELEPTRGLVVRGTQTRVAYFDQARAQLDDDMTIYENVADVSRHAGANVNAGGMVKLGDRTVDVRTYLEQFLFEPAKQRQKVGSLSGGERARVSLAKIMKMGANLLLLDEPTNDLDVATLGALEEMLSSWSGCALVVSHDRYFLNRVATSILAFEDGGAIVRYPGNYDTYRSLKAEAEASRSEKGDRSVKGKAGGAAPVPAKLPEKAEKKSRLTYSERLELEGIMARITAAEEKAAALATELHDPALYASRPEAARDLQARLTAAEAAVQALTQRWEDLEARAAG
jgi:ATP-binding cassette subfamily F protein uup